MVVAEVRTEGALQVLLVDHDDVVEALAPIGSDEPLDQRILPRTSSRGEDFLDAQPRDPLAKGVTVDPIPVSCVRSAWSSVRGTGAVATR